MSITKDGKRLPVIYLSGPMSGKPNHNFPAFNRMAAKLRHLGFPVINPADFGANPAQSWKDCLVRDIAALGNAEVIWMLPGWHASKGAALERYVADSLGGIRTVEIDEQADFLREFFEDWELLRSIRVFECAQLAAWEAQRDQMPRCGLAVDALGAFLVTALTGPDSLRESQLVEIPYAS